MRGHLTWQDYDQRFAARGIDLGKKFVTFSVVRNPWAWHVSWFTYIRADEGGRKSGHKIEAELFSRFSFQDYLHWLDDPDAPRGPQGYMQRQLRDWVVDTDGKMAVKHVLRTETMQKDLVALRDRYKLQITVPKKPLNVSSKSDYRSFYRSADIDKIGRRHAADIEFFEYRFE